VKDASPSALPTAHFKPASDQSLLVYFDEAITEDARYRVLKLLRLLESHPIRGVRNLHPAYSSLLVKFDALSLTHDELQATLETYIKRLETLRLAEPRQIEIPVCYGGEFGPDLDDFAALHKLTAAEVIAAHASAAYVVSFLGFAPGFAYLQGLPEHLATPRLQTPRRQVPAGSVGIAGRQTGVYPFSTPGGWRLIGRTPLKMFSPYRQPMSLLQIGDGVRFTAISAWQFASMASK
jgi:inhibitor of KinA